MGFVRTLVSPDGRLPQPMRAGIGLLANFAPKVFAAQVDATLTVADITGGLVHQGTTLTSDVVYTLPTAALILAAYPEMDIGDAWSFVVTNSQVGAFDVVLGLGVGITTIGANNTISAAPQSSRIFTLIKTSATAMTLH